MNPLLPLGLLIAGYILGKVISTLMRRRRGGDPNAGVATAELRRMALGRTVADFTEPPVQGVFGVLMELGMGGGVATIVGHVDGNASLYLSTGGGILGGAGHEPVRKAARQLCEIAATMPSNFTSTTDFPVPSRGHVRFYLTTEDGVRTAETEESAVRRAEHPLHALYAAGHDLLTALRISSS